MTPHSFFSPDALPQAGQAWLQTWLDWLGGLAAAGTPDEGAEKARITQELAARAAALQPGFAQQHLVLWTGMLSREAGHAYTPVVSPDRADRRFSAAEWRDNPYYDYLKQAYLINLLVILQLRNSSCLQSNFIYFLKHFKLSYWKLA